MTVQNQQGFPNVSAPLVDISGRIQQVWLRLLITIWNRTGGSSNTTLTAVSPTVGELAVFSEPQQLSSGNLSGDVTTSGGLVTTLANSGVTAGTYTIPIINLDSKGRAISAMNSAITGSGSVVLANTPTLIGPNLGTPSSVDLTNAIDLPLSTGVTGILPIINGGTGSTTQNFVDLTTNQSVSGIKTFSTQLIGKGTETNDDAGTGYIGEYDSTVSSSVGLTNNTSTTITSVVLQPGDYDIWGSVGFTGGITTITQQINIGISETANTLPTFPAGGYTFLTWTSPGFTGINPALLQVGLSRITVAAGTTTTIYLIAFANFTTSTLSAYGVLNWRRIR